MQGGDYERLAPWYGLLEGLVFGGHLQRCRVRFLPELRQAGRVLIVGEGSGRALLPLLQENPDCRVDVLEPSGAMTRLAKKRVTRHDPRLLERVRFLPERWEHWAGPGNRGGHGDELYDGVILPFVLDLFGSGQQKVLARKLKAWSGPGAHCLISDFRVEHRNGLLQRCLYAGARWTTGLRIADLADYSAAMNDAGWCLAQEAVFAGGAVNGQVWVPA